MKYIGSKAKIANSIVKVLHRYISEYGITQYIEPFVGGFNVIDKVHCVYRLGSDINPLLCDLVEACRENPALLDELQTPTRAEFYEARDNACKYARWHRAAILLFASHNANTYGGCKYFEKARENFRRQLPALRNILIGCCDYRELRLPMRERVLVYCDPPHSDGKFDMAAFWEWCRTQTATGHIVIASAPDAPADFVCIWKCKITQNRIEKLFIQGGSQCQKFTN